MVGFLKSDVKLSTKQRADFLQQAGEDFDRFDTTKTGTWTRQECKQSIVYLISIFSDKFSSQDPEFLTEQFMTNFCLEKDGSISRQEYLAVMKRSFDDDSITKMNAEVFPKGTQNVS